MVDSGFDYGDYSSPFERRRLQKIQRRLEKASRGKPVWRANKDDDDGPWWENDEEKKERYVQNRRRRNTNRAKIGGGLAVAAGLAGTGVHLLQNQEVQAANVSSIIVTPDMTATTANFTPLPPTPTETPTPTATSEVTPQPTETEQYIKEVKDILTNGNHITALVGGEQVNLNSQRPETFPPYFDTISSKGISGGIRSEYGFQEQIGPNRADGQDLYDLVILESTDFSQNNDSLRQDAEYNAKERTVFILQEFYTNLVGYDYAFQGKLNDFWREVLLPSLGTSEKYSPFFVNYSQYFTNLGPITIQLPDGTTQEIQSWNDLLKSDFSDDVRLAAVKAYKEKLAHTNEDAYRKLNFEEGTRLAAFLHSAESFRLYSILPDYEVKGENAPFSIVPEININGPLEYEPNTIYNANWEVWREEGKPPFYDEMIEQICNGNDPYSPVDGSYRLGYDLGREITYQFTSEQRRNGENGLHRGVDFILNENVPPPIIAPCDMWVIQAKGTGTWYGTSENGMGLGMGDNVVIGYFGDFTYHDENGDTMVGDVFTMFGHMKTSSTFQNLIEQKYGHSSPHEVVSVFVPAGTEVGIMGDDGFTDADIPLTHLHYEVFVSWRTKNGVPVGNPNPHLSMQKDGVPPGARYTKGPDGKLYLQIGDVYQQFVEQQGSAGISRNEHYQWPFGENILFIKFYDSVQKQSGVLWKDNLANELASLGIESKTAHGKPVATTNRFTNSVVAVHHSTDANHYTVRLRNPEQNLSLQTNGLYINGLVFPVKDREEVRARLDEIRALGKDTTVQLDIQRRGQMARLAFRNQQGEIRQMSFVMGKGDLSADPKFTSLSPLFDNPLKKENDNISYGFLESAKEFDASKAGGSGNKRILKRLYNQYVNDGTIDWEPAGSGFWRNKNTGETRKFKGWQKKYLQGQFGHRFHHLYPEAINYSEE